MSVTLAMGAPVDLTPNAAVPIEAWATAVQLRGWFEDRGRGPLGFDCLGLAVWAQGYYGRSAPSYADFYRGLDIQKTRDVDALFRAESAAWRNVEAGKPGDVLVLGRGGRAHHVAVLCGGGAAIDAMQGVGLRIAPFVSRTRVTEHAGMKVFACVRPS